MLKKCKSALLLTEVKSFSDNYKALASDIDVDLRVEKEWNTLYRVNEEVIVLSSKFLSFVNKSYLSKVVLILKETESPSEFISMGVTRFIFNHRNKYELLCAFYVAEPVMVDTKEEKFNSVLKKCLTLRFKFRDYDFQFDTNRFFYKGKQLYLIESAKRYLAEWLLMGKKDNKKRMILCNLRKKFGDDFLRDIDRFGQLKGGENEQ